MSEIQHWEIDQDFYRVCEENVNTVLDNLDLTNPVILKPFHNFEQFEDQWWNEFYASYFNKNVRINDSTKGKFKYLERTGINVLDSIVDNLASKIFNDPRVTIWMSPGELDSGTDWHTDFRQTDEHGRPYEEANPSYLICMNFIGTTKWEFETGEEVMMYPGSILWQCGATAHKVTSLNNLPRVTCAMHNIASDFVL
tara:strand:- start:11 stop:601 length:591 start_codon:yes stop_codon:yes gene_type:complete